MSRSMTRSVSSPPGLLVGVDVGELRHVLQGVGAACRDQVREVAQVVALQRVLVLRVAGAAADADVLRPPAGRARAGDAGRACGRSRAITWSADILRSASGFSDVEAARDEVPPRTGLPPPPVKPTTVVHRRIGSGRS